MVIPTLLSFPFHFDYYPHGHGFIAAINWKSADKVSEISLGRRKIPPPTKPAWLMA